MINYALILPSSVYGTLPLQKTYQLLLPHSMINSYDSQLCGNILWILKDVRNGTRVSARLHIVSTELLEDGPQVGSILIDANVDISMYYEPEDIMNKNAWTLATNDCDTLLRGKIQLVSYFHIKRFEDIIEKSVEHRLTPPNKLVLDYLDYTPKNNDIHNYAKALARSLKKKYSVGDLYLHVRDSSELNVYDSVTIYYLRERFGCPDDTAKSCVNKLILERENAALNIRDATPRIDVFLRRIDPSQIFSRRFINSSNKHTGDYFVEQLRKTDQAEHRHQDILRDIVTILTRLGITSMETQSIDLAIETSCGLALFEVKSACQYNFLEQVTKGAIQILQYRFALQQAGESVCQTGLIVDSCRCYSAEKYLSSFLNSIGIDLLLYCDEDDWPNRLKILGSNKNPFLPQILLK